MEEKKIEANLAEMCNISGYETIYNRINDFAKLCKIGKIDLLKVRGTNVKVVSGKCNEAFIPSLEYPNDKMPEYFITSRDITDSNYGKGNFLNGNFADLNFTFVNYYANSGNNAGLNPPFYIQLVKLDCPDEYIFDIKPVSSDEVEFSITRNYFRKGNIVPENYTFYYKTKDFNEILSIAYTFVYNPIFAFDEYKRIYLERIKRKIVFKKEDMENTMMVNALSQDKVKKIGNKK